MAKIKGTTNAYVFMCPGCKVGHRFDCETWKFNGDMNKPTLDPSYLTWGDGRYVNGKWSDKPWKCHSYVKAGQIQFLTDSTHDLAGITVDLEDF